MCHCHQFGFAPRMNNMLLWLQCNIKCTLLNSQRIVLTRPSKHKYKYKYKYNYKYKVHPAKQSAHRAHSTMEDLTRALQLPIH